VGAQQASTDSCLMLTSISASVWPFFIRNLPTRCKSANGISPEDLAYRASLRAHMLHIIVHDAASPYVQYT